MTIPEVIDALKRLHDLTNDEGKREVAAIVHAILEWQHPPNVPAPIPEAKAEPVPEVAKEPEPKAKAKAKPVKEKPVAFKSGGRFAKR